MSNDRLPKKLNEIVQLFFVRLSKTITMVNITLLSFFIFSALANFLQFRNKFQYYKRLNYTVFGAGILLLNYKAFESAIESVLPLPSLLLTVLGISFILAIIVKRITVIAFAFLPVLASLAFLFLPEYDLNYYGNIVSSNNDLFVFALLGAITPILTHGAKLLVSNLVVKFGNVTWKEEQENQLETIVTYTFVAGLTLMSSQMLGSLGILVASTFYLATTILSEDKLGINNILAFTAAGTLFLINSIPFFLDYGNFEVLDITRGEVLAGFFFAGLLMFFHKIFLRFSTNSQNGWSYLYLLKNYLFPLFITFVLGILYTQKENLGGILSLSSLILGLAILSPVMAFSSNRVAVPIHMGVIAVSLSLLPLIKPVVIEVKSDLDLIKKEENVSVEEQKGESLDLAKGKWEINGEKSTLKFALGPEKSRTKGVFKEIKGSFFVPSDITKSEFYVQIPVKSLSTFISMRDEHLMEEDYFNEERFSSIVFKSDKITQDGDAYIANGKFKMKGIENDLDVKFKVLGVAEKEGKEILILNVKSTLDRTNFGMNPDEKIGNLVEFDFQVQLEK